MRQHYGTRMHHFSSLENVSGTAKMVKNNGSSITLQFSNYKFEVSRSGKTHDFILDGTLEFKCYMYD